MGYTEFVKHLRYKSMYKENDLFWGLGIEEETYLQFTKPLNVAAPIIKSAHMAERYSVPYYKTYNPSYRQAFEKLFPTDGPERGFFQIPFLLNAHAFNKTDIHGNHQTTYQVNPQPNPKFSGKTLYEELCNFLPSLPIYNCIRQPRFLNIFNKYCIFDGDSIEFVTQNFYKAKADCVIGELVDAKRDLLNAINTFLIQRGLHTEKGHLMYPTVNHGFAVQYTNPKNICMFNNGTYHINITLPTMLGKADKKRLPCIENYAEFKEKHKKFIRFIQWLEPFIVGVYGTADPLSAVSPLYSNASQRGAVSRYIGLCTYDTNAMPSGKIVTVPVKDIRGSDKPFWWYKVFHAESGYNELNELGMDISFRKHYNHGVEIRFLDWFPENMLKGILEFYVRLGDLSLDSGVLMPGEAIMSEDYNNFLVGVLREGKAYVLPEKMVHIYEDLLGIPIRTIRPTVSRIYEIISSQIMTKYKNGVCAKLML